MVRKSKSPRSNFYSGALTPDQEELVKFYALVITVYYLCEDMEVRKKRVQKYTRKVEVLLGFLGL